LTKKEVSISLARLYQRIIALYSSKRHTYTLKKTITNTKIYCGFSVCGKREIEPDKEAERQRDRERKRDRETEKERERERERKKDTDHIVYRVA